MTTCLATEACSYDNNDRLIDSDMGSCFGGIADNLDACVPPVPTGKGLNEMKPKQRKPLLACIDAAIRNPERFGQQP